MQIVHNLAFENQSFITFEEIKAERQGWNQRWKHKATSLRRTFHLQNQFNKKPKPPN